MPKIYPNIAGEASNSPAPTKNREESVYTVWRKSLLFNCEGFTVYDSKGDLVYRVDNYASPRRREVLLMDAVGEPLLTIRKKKLTLMDQWLAFDGEKATNPIFLVRKNNHFARNQTKNVITHIDSYMVGGGGEESSWKYEIEGSYIKSSCSFYDENRQLVAKIQRKNLSIGTDVFQLVVSSGFDSTMAMGIVMVLEQMFSNRG